MPGRGRRLSESRTPHDPTQVSPEWHGWLHHTLDKPPTVEPPKVKPWEREHKPNLTGTPLAHKPAGSIMAGGQRPHATGDYEAWQPE